MSKKRIGFGAFIAGTALGAGLGILFAPKKGSETREDLKKTFDDFAKKVSEIDVEEIKKEFEKKMKELEVELKSLNKEKVLSAAKETGVAIKEKSDELVKLAVDKGTPVIRRNAVRIKAKAIATSKDVIAKLEKEEEVKEEK